MIRHMLLISMTCLLLSVVSATGQDVQNLPENHYLVWNLDHQIQLPGPIILFDQFGDVLVDFTFQEKWGNPIYDKQLGAGPIEAVMWDPMVHHLWYRIEPPVPQQPRELIATHQWRRQYLQVFEAIYFINPADKEFMQPPWPEYANHYLCYRAQGDPMWDNNMIFVSDQWGPWHSFVWEPFCFCNPAEKQDPSGMFYPIQDPDLHLTCYRVDPVPAFMPFAYEDQFGVWQNIAIETCVVCLPSLKEYPILPTNDSTWGKIKSLYSNE